MKSVNKEGTEGLNGHSHFVSRIVTDGYLKMCVLMWDGSRGLRGYLERVAACSKLKAKDQVTQVILPKIAEINCIILSRKATNQSGTRSYHRHSMDIVRL